MDIKEWVKLQEELLKAQLQVIRGYRRGTEPSNDKQSVIHDKSKSQISMIRDILLSVGTPLHVSEIIHQVKEKFGVNLDRESVVSALTKKVKKGAAFVRTGPNIFGLKEQ